MGCGHLASPLDDCSLLVNWGANGKQSSDSINKVKVTIRVESEKGFDKSELQNGVLEPLREADLIE